MPELCIYISDERYRKLVKIVELDPRYDDEGKLVEDLFKFGFEFIYESKEKSHITWPFDFVKK